MNGGGRMAAIALTAIIAGCAASTPITTADGRLGHAIDCGSDYLNSSWTTCYQRAGEICGAHGYNIIERIGEHGGGSTDFNRSLIIACKKV
jgi:hypothetical protein